MTTKLASWFYSTGMGPMARYKLPSAAETAVVFLFLIAWLSPVIASWGVSASGFQFSFVAPHWQNKNVDIVGMCISVALISGIVAALIAQAFLSRIAKRLRSDMFIQGMNGAQRFFLVAVSLMAAVGLFKSFGGTIFEKGYAGPSISWLGYGAWGVTYLISVNLLAGDFLARKAFHPVMIFAVSVLFFPFLLSGSRIDFLSAMLALGAYILVLHDAKFHVRIFWALITLALVVGVSILIGNIRYESYGFTIPGKLSNEMFYLSTIGDIGASVFQVVGLIQLKTQWIVGVGDAAFSYATRLLPGPFFPNRPGNFQDSLPELIGGGALHALGEGYLIYGMAGCIVVGAVFGVLAALSVFAGNKLRSNRAPIWWIVFAFPWLLMIRGGWYQFFSLLKAIEVLLILMLMLVAVGWVGRKYSALHGREQACP